MRILNVCLFLLGLLGALESAEGAQRIIVDSVATVVINPAIEHQTIRGFGASDAWSIERLRQWPKDKGEQVARWLFSKAIDRSGQPLGIGLSQWRANIGAGSAEQGKSSGIKDPWRRAESVLGLEGYDFSKQEGMQWMLCMAKSYGVEDFTAFSNSPPVVMTKNGRAFADPGGYSNLEAEAYQDFVEYISQFLLGIEQTSGVHFTYVSPFNEPQWDWDGGQEGSPWSNQAIYDIVKRLSQSFQRKGIRTKIEISDAAKLNYLYESADKPDRANHLLTFFKPSSSLFLGDLPQLAQKVTAHSYYTTYPEDYCITSRQNLHQLMSQEYPHLEYWMSEYCILENNPIIRGRGRDLGMDAALYMARVIHNDLTLAQASSWQWWLAVSPYNYKDGLIYMDKNEQDGAIYDSKLLWTFGHFSRFIRPGYKRIAVTGAQSKTKSNGAAGLLVSAYKAPDSESQLVVVSINQTTEEQHLFLSVPSWGDVKTKSYVTSNDLTHNLSPIEGTGNQRISLPPQSINTTLITKKIRL